jgi:hypothetical protein
MLTRLVVVIIFENFSFALFTPPLGDFHIPKSLHTPPLCDGHPSIWSYSPVGPTTWGPALENGHLSPGVVRSRVAAQPCPVP